MSNKNIYEDIDDWIERERLHDAAADGDLTKVKELVAKDYDVNAFNDGFGWTPLHCAVRGEHIDVAKYLLSVGADVNSHQEERIGETPLGEVAANCSFEIAELLVKAGANPTIPGWMGITALYSASKRKRVEGLLVYELLLETAQKKFHWKV